MKARFLLLGTLLVLASCAEEKAKVEIPQPKVAVPAEAMLAEGAFWHERTGRLFWVDIEGKKLHISNPSDGSDLVYEMGARIGTVVPNANGDKALVALQSGIQCFDFATEAFALLAHPQDSVDEHIRYNDGKADPKGNFWVGGMHLQQKHGAAQLYRINAQGQSTSMLPEVTISNGITWNEDGSLMYYIDTPTQEVKAFPIHSDGLLGDYSVVIDLPDSLGYPDGMTIDAEGKLWIAHWGGGCVGRWDPVTGEQLMLIKVPAPNVSSCAFGGSDLQTLYITTARVGLSEEDLAKYPDSGSVFSVKLPFKGRKMHTFDACK